MKDESAYYLLPAPYRGQVAFLPFLVEEFFENGVPRYLVSRARAGFAAAPFEPGVEIVRWNGVPIADAVMLNGNRYAGSNLEARRARGIETLTVRPLTTNLPPDEERVILDYRAADGSEHELRVPWRVFQPAAAGGAAAGSADAVLNWGMDVEVQLCREAKKHLFAPQVVEAEAQMAAAVAVAPTDLLQRNVDLIERAASLLAGMPRRRLEIAGLGRDGANVVLTVRTLGISRLDVYDRQRPLGSVDVADGETELRVSATDAAALELLGFDDGALVAARRIR